MPLRKSLRKGWHKAFSWVSRTDDSQSGTFPRTPPLAGQPEPVIPPTLQAPPTPIETPISGGETQTMSQGLISTPRADQAGSQIFARSHDFVLNHPIIGESQNLHLHYERTQHPSREEIKVSPQAGTQTSLPGNSPNQGHPIAQEIAGLSGEGRNPTFIGQTQNVQIHNNLGRPNVLRELQEYTIAGSAFNSAERDPPPRCHPGTRTSIREKLGLHIKSTNQKARIIWIHGPAGVGKSAIMQTVVEEMEPHVTFATLFFSRPNRRHDAKKALTTLAYGLAVANPEYRQYIGTKIEDDPTCLKKSLEEQFKTLFVVPFVKKHVEIGTQRWVMFLDGLDECENIRGLDNQCRILNLISDSILQHATSTPFTWVIASRPEDNLKKAWLQIQHQFRGRTFNIWEFIIPVDSDEATRDVELFLHKEFETIRAKYSDLMPRESRWPSDSHFVKVAKKSSGLFVFASTVIKYVADEDPVARLEFVVSLIDQAEENPATDDESPFHMVDLLYSSIMSDIPRRLLPIVTSLLGVYLLSDSLIVQPRKTGPKVSLMEACNILGLRQNEAYAALRKLQSVLICPPPEKAQKKGIQFFHASFPDFLLDRSRSREYQINLEEEINKIWPRYTSIIRQSVNKGYAGIETSWLPSNNTTVSGDLQRELLTGIIRQSVNKGYAGIETSWLPSNNTTLLGDLQRELLWQAQNGWVTIVMNYFCNPTAPRRLQVDVPELVEVLQSLGPAFLAVGYFPLEEFLLWLQYAPSEIQEAIVLQRFTLPQLNIERLFKSLCAKPQYRYAVGSHIKEVDFTRSVAGAQWTQVKEAFWTPKGKFCELEEAFNKKGNPVTVIVVGTEPSESYAIIGPISKDRAFYIFPYSVS